MLCYEAVLNLIGSCASFKKPLGPRRLTARPKGLNASAMLKLDAVFAATLFDLSLEQFLRRRGLGVNNSYNALGSIRLVVSRCVSSSMQYFIK